MEVSLFFEFIQVAVGNRKSLSVGISDADWHRLFEFCKKQALIGVGFTAVEKLHAMGMVCPAALRMQWMALALQIESRNGLLNEQCRQLTDRYKHDGLSTCILKGQGNLLNYPEHLRKRRQCGDIDVWTVCKNGIPIAVLTGKDKAQYVEYHGRKAVIEYVRMQHRLEGNIEKPVIRYHHIEAPKIDGTEVEAHFRPCYSHSPLRNWRMQRWFNDHADVCMKNKTHMGFAVPTASVNVVYQMCHLFSHYFDEGLGLRQLMDYYFALKAWQKEIMDCKSLQSQGMWSEGLGTPVMSAQEVMAVLRSFGMAKFASAVMWVLNEVFSMPKRQLITDDRLFASSSSISKFLITDGANENDNENDNEKGNDNEKDNDNENGPRRKQRDMEGCLQADEVGEQVLITDDRLLITDGYSITDDRLFASSSSISKFLITDCPWMIWEPNEKEGRKLLAEIMQGGNFGQYDTRDAALKKGGMIKHGLWKLKRVMRLVSSYPEEALWEPVFRVWHLGWRLMNG